MMTSEREEVIDFVAPYFDQSGISISKLYNPKNKGKMKVSTSPTFVRYYSYFLTSLLYLQYSFHKIHVPPIFRIFF